MSDYYDVHVAAEQRAADKLLQDRNAVHNTTFTYIQQTRGVGHRVLNIEFDVVFSAEPVFTSGAALTGITHSGFLPVCSALVLRWSRNARGAYVGVQLVVLVDLRVAAGFAPFGNLPAAGGSATPVVVVSHSLSFAGPARPVSSRAAVTQAQTIGVEDSGMGRY